MKRLFIIILVLTISFSLKANDTSEIRKRIDTLMNISRLGEEYAKSDKFDSAYFCLSQAVDMLAKLNQNDIVEKNILTIPMIYNGMGVYFLVKEKEYSTAIAYFLKGMKYCEMYELWDGYCSISFNLVYVYFTKNDPDGLLYAEEFYNKGLLLKNKRMESIGAYSVASMYYIDGNITKAEEYLKIVLTSDYIHLMETNVNNLRANIARDKGDFHSANEYFSKAINSLEQVPASESIYICLSYARFLVENKEYSKAIGIIYKSIDIGSIHDIHDFEQEAYLLLSEAYAADNQWKNSLQAHRKYYKIAVETFDIQKQKDLSDLMFHYDSEKKELELNRKELLLSHKTSQLYFLFFIMLAISLISFVLFKMYQNKNKMYVAIVEKYRAENQIKKSEKENKY